jgi:acetyl-CoA C-acetyltransferase
MTHKMNRMAAIAGAGSSKFGAFPDKLGRELFTEAFLTMLGSVDRGIETKDIEALYVGSAAPLSFEGQGHLAPIIADQVGLVNRPATRVESACASGGLALREGIIGVASGIYDIVLVGGVEKMTNLPTSDVTEVLAAFSDAPYEACTGITFPGAYALLATAYRHKYGLTEEQLMAVAMKNHQNGALNPIAQFYCTISDIMTNRLAKMKEKGQPVPNWRTEMDFLKDPQANPIVAWPLRLFDCSPITDGAACVLLVAEHLAKSFTDTPIYVVGSGQASDYSLSGRGDLTTLGGAKEAARQAYEMAGVHPEDIQMAEVHDCFTIAEIIATEDLGFFEPGEGGKAVEQGLTALQGPKPVNPSGGLKAKGHPVGASGIAQVVEVWHQMRGGAGARQIKNRELNLALTHNVGAHGASCLVHIYERR